MLLSDILTKVRQRINDTGATDYLDNELISYYNDASDVVGAFLISIGDADMITTANITDGTSKPSTWVSFSGQYPLHEENGTWKLDVTGPIPVRYWATKQHLVNTTDTVPYKDYCAVALVSIASNYALNRNELYGTVDQALVDAALAELKAAKLK